MRFLIGLFATVFISSAALSQPTLEDYAAMPSAWRVAISPDGNSLAVGCSPRGVRELCIYDLTGQNNPRLIPQPEDAWINNFEWLSSNFLAFQIQTTETLLQRNSMEDLLVTRLAVYSMDEANTAIMLHQLSNYLNTTDISSKWTSEEETILMEMTMSSIRYSQRVRTVLFEVNLRTGDAIARENPGGEVLQYFMNDEGEIIADIRLGEDLEREVWRVGDSEERIFSEKYEIDYPLFWGLIDDGQALAVNFPNGEHRGLKRLDLHTGEIAPLTLDGAVVGAASPIMDRHLQELVGISYTSDLNHQSFWDDELQTIQDQLSSTLPEEVIYLVSWTPDRNNFVVLAETTGQPGRYYLFDADAGEISLVSEVAGRLDSVSHGERIPYSFTATDGLDIPAYLTLPMGQTLEDGPFLTILMPHGGPRGRSTAHFDWWAGYYAAMGYAVFEPNFRGSTGYGQAFEEAGYGEFGDAMVTDVLDGWRALIDEGIAKPDGFCAIGASYGGYSALMLALLEVEAAQCVVSVAGVTNPYAMLAGNHPDSTSTRFWERYWGSRFDSDAERLRITPSRRTGDFQAPVLIIHGDLDVTVPIGQARLFRREMDERSSFRYVVMEGEDHYLRSTNAREIVLRESGSFLQEHFPVGE